MSVSLIAAVSRNGVIGQGNELPWRIPEDLARFRRLTMGHWVIMGRRTFESIGRPLPGRKSIVLTRQPGYAPAGVAVARSLEEALALAAADGDDVFVAGGAEVFRDALPLADRMLLTLIDAEVEGDTSFPPFDRSAWRVTEDEPSLGAPGLWPYRFVTLARRAPDAGAAGHR